MTIYFPNGYTASEVDLDLARFELCDQPPEATQRILELGGASLSEIVLLRQIAQLPVRTLPEL